MIIVAVRITAASGQIRAKLSLRARAETLALPRVHVGRFHPRADLRTFRDGTLSEALLCI